MMNSIDVKEKMTNEGFQSRNHCKEIDNDENIVMMVIVTDIMQRESAIADDYWRETFQSGKKDPTEISLKSIERK